MTNLALLEDAGAVRRGHFLLSSGRHSNTYVEKTRVFEDPELTMSLARDVASWFEGETMDVVVSPAVGAVPFGFAVAHAVHARFIYAEREAGSMTLRRGFELRPSETALVVEDVVTTGGSAAEVHALVEASGARSLGVVALVDRSTADLPFPLRALTRVVADVWAPDACPRCAEGVPLESPGSRHLV